MTPVLVLAAVGAVSMVLFVVGLLQGTPDPSPRLRSRYVRLRRLGVDAGLEELTARLATTRQRFPGRSEAWCLRWLVEDLERAKR